jgi:glycerol-3-phosphate acyltransferase PlsY
MLFTPFSWLVYYLQTLLVISLLSTLLVEIFILTFLKYIMSQYYLAYFYSFLLALLFLMLTIRHCFNINNLLQRPLVN